ncbi:DUF3375 domain-containing protein [Sulfurimonas sp.]|uniref:DUF3375 domain-containing protein n=1 Tax=Sulfurimonas sp. TaxID=2022749 RepID=UPI002B4A3F80|nr:DUF3375 domain-containing protein [Sulfurimonas sp.]
MKYDYLKHLKNTNQTIKLLNSDNFAFMLSFFHFVFVKKAYIVIPHSQIIQYLDDYLYDINNSYNNIFVKTAKEYLDDFSNDKNAYLRKYHGEEDEPLYELTPHTNKALEFIESLAKSEFVASRSKFNIIFELLEDLEFETKLDNIGRIKKLQKQKDEIDRQIEAIKLKKDLRFDSARIKEHYIQIDELVRKLKYDFSEMEYNFRDLNKLAMENITLRDDTKSGVLDCVFEVEDSIRNSAQGKSFFAFWQLLTDAKRSEKLTKLLKNLYEIESIKSMDKDEKLTNIKYTLLKSADKIYKVSAKLIEQLRRFIDDRVWIENKRVLDLCKNIEKSAILLKDKQPTQREFFSIKGDNIKIDSIFEKSLYTPKIHQEFEKNDKPQEINIEMDSFYNLFFVDEEILKKNIAQMLQSQPQCTLEQIIKKFTISKGISELVSYVNIAKNSEDTTVEESILVKLEVIDLDGVTKVVKMPKIVFTKGKI